jgi:hypothetical protein
LIRHGSSTTLLTQSFAAPVLLEKR